MSEGGVARAVVVDREAYTERRQPLEVARLLHQTQEQPLCPVPRENRFSQRQAGLSRSPCAEWREACPRGRRARQLGSHRPRTRDSDDEIAHRATAARSSPRPVAVGSRSPGSSPCRCGHLVRRARDGSSLRILRAVGSGIPRTGSSPQGHDTGEPRTLVPCSDTNQRPRNSSTAATTRSCASTRVWCPAPSMGRLSASGTRLVNSWDPATKGASREP